MPRVAAILRREGGASAFSQKPIHFNVTKHPTLEWAKQQVKNACFEQQPKSLLHDNDGTFGELGRPQGVDTAGKWISCRSTFDACLWRVMGIRGIPIPYGLHHDYRQAASSYCCFDFSDPLMLLSGAYNVYIHARRRNLARAAGTLSI